MEKQEANIIFSVERNNEEYSSDKCALMLPKGWVDRMGINREHRQAELSFDGDRIIIERPYGSPIKHAPLASGEKIRRFALIWMQMYKNHKTTPFIYFDDCGFVGDGLADLGFEMDAGESLAKQFPDISNFDDIDVWKSIVNRLDIRTLGNAIFSRWRYFNHWSMGPMKEEDFEWFVIGFRQLAGLSEDFDN